MKSVFVGSSGAAMKHSRAVCKALEAAGLTPLPWWEQFPPGTVTLEAIEAVLQKSCGAVLLASPDDMRMHKGESQHVSRDNVILELGMFSARLGRHNVALLRYDDVVLPTDLSGFTHIKMGPFDPEREVRSISAAARAQLATWAEGLQALAEGIPRTVVLHGYSGRWHVTCSFSRWWDREVVAPDYVSMDGEALIYVPLSSSGGSGSFISIINAVVHEPRSSMRLKSVQTIEQVSCDAQGVLRLVNTVFSREVLEASGEVPAEGGFQQRALGPARFTTEFRPQQGQPRVLAGSTMLEVGGRPLMVGELRIEKLD
jgi:hypothetical protein